MSFLELEPAAQRLRSAAKAHADGEIAHEEYRRLRHEIIDELHITFAAKNAVESSPFDRFGVANAGNLPLGQQPSANSALAVTHPEDVGNPTKTNSARRPLLLVTILLTGVLLSLFALIG